MDRNGFWNHATMQEIAKETNLSFEQVYKWHYDKQKLLMRKSNAAIFGDSLP